MECSLCGAIFLGLGAIPLYLLYNFIKGRLLQKKLEKWSHTPKDIVILHGLPPAKTIPNASPFIFKVQTFMRMANIRYLMDTEDPFGPTGKTPWISVNGQHISDSEFIIEFLSKKFEKNLNKDFTPEQVAIGNAVRIMLDEHFFWGFALERLVYSPFSHFQSVMDMPRPFIMYFSYLMGSRAKSQGMGIHPKENVRRILTKELQIVSTILGDKKFICGEQPCDADASIFNWIAQCLWALPQSPYQGLINEELSNLKAYALRIKERYWSDWDQVLAK